MESLLPIIAYHDSKQETAHEIVSLILTHHDTYGQIISYNEYMEYCEGIGLTEYLSLEEYHELVLNA